MVLWDVDGDPDPAEDAEAMARRVVDKARPGSIVLLHVMARARASSRAALPQMLDGLAARGLEVTTLGRLLALAAA